MINQIDLRAENLLKIINRKDEDQKKVDYVNQKRNRFIEKLKKIQDENLINSNCFKSCCFIIDKEELGSKHFFSNKIDESLGYLFVVNNSFLSKEKLKLFRAFLKMDF